MLMRLWWQLGFGFRQAPAFDTPYVVIGLHYSVTWRDRLRILLSGEIQVAVGVNYPIDSGTPIKSTFSVLHPGYKISTTAQ